MSTLELFEQELRLSKSMKTVAVYSRQFKLFVQYFSGRDLRSLPVSEIKSYIVSLQSVFGYSAIVQAISAVKFYYLKVCSRKRVLLIDNPPKPKHLPTVLSLGEVRSMIHKTTNIKHRALLETLFFHGLRRSELLNLKIIDIDSSSMLLHIREGKGLKDRNIPLAVECLNTLRDYYRREKPREYLFNGSAGRSQYSAASLRNVVLAAAKRAGIKKDVHPHTLRHSFASYLVSIDVNIKKIQDWLGHSSLKYTEVYCHVFPGRNPISLI